MSKNTDDRIEQSITCEQVIDQNWFFALAVDADDFQNRASGGFYSRAEAERALRLLAVDVRRNRTKV